MILETANTADYDDNQPKPVIKGQAQLASRVSIRKPRVVSARPQIKQMARLVQERVINKNEVPAWK